VRVEVSLDVADVLVERGADLEEREVHGLDDRERELRGDADDGRAVVVIALGEGGHLVEPDDPAGRGLRLGQS
jgi:hypothetical protein